MVTMGATKENCDHPPCEVDDDRNWSFDSADLIKFWTKMRLIELRVGRNLA